MRQQSLPRKRVSRAPKPPTLTEAQFQSQVIDLARLFGWSVYHTYDSRRSAAGFPDLSMVRPPRAIFAELKTETGRVRPEQRDWLDKLSGCGLEVFLWRPSHWESIVAELRKP